MARPFKQGLQYFPLDVHVFEDPKLESLHYHYGPFGVFIYIRILTLIYKQGYYLKRTAEELALTLHKLIGPHWIRVDKILEIIDACVELRLFGRALFLQGVITSVSIQQQYVLSTKRRRNLNIDEYWLLDQATMEKLGVLLNMQKNNDNVNNNAVIDDSKSVIARSSTQSKKESKRDKIDKRDKSIYGFPKMHFLTKVLIQKKYIKQLDLNIFKYNALFEEAIIEFGYENVLSVVNYIVSYCKKSKVVIDSRFSFMKKALMNNLKHFKNMDAKRGVDIEDWIKQEFFRLD